jgi:AraC-like DNA-binding protein
LAKKYATNAYQIAIKQNTASGISQSAKHLAQIYEAEKDFPTALFYQKTHQQYNDSLLNTDFISKLKNLQQQHKFEKKQLQLEYEIINKNSIISKKQKTIRLYASILILIVAIFIITIREFFLLKKKNKLLFKKTVELTKTEQFFEADTTHLSTLPNLESQPIDFSDTELTNSLEKLFKEEKLYTDNSITLNILAEKLKTNRTYLSREINKKYQCNFNQLINKYRIKEARKILLTEKYKNYTIEGIAQEVGFNSKSSFNAAFKSYTGITPSYYRNTAKTEMVSIM